MPYGSIFLSYNLLGDSYNPSMISTIKRGSFYGEKVITSHKSFYNSYLPRQLVAVPLGLQSIIFDCQVTRWHLHQFDMHLPIFVPWMPGMAQRWEWTQQDAKQWPACKWGIARQGIYLWIKSKWPQKAALILAWINRINSVWAKKQWQTKNNEKQ